MQEFIFGCGGVVGESEMASSLDHLSAEWAHPVGSSEEETKKRRKCLVSFTLAWAELVLQRFGVGIGAV